MLLKNSLLVMIFLLLICTSCEKVIPVALDSSSTQIVIEGQITANKGPYYVRVSESVGFDAAVTTFPGRNDAIVTIKDLTANITETLTSAGSGLYQSTILQGVGGRSYLLTVTVGGKTYTATSTIPLKAVKIDRLFAKKFALNSDDIYMVPVFTDPVGKGNYYRLKQYVRGIEVKGSYVRSDEATDGLTYDGQLFYSTAAADGNPLINNGDMIAVELQCVDKGAYDYFRTLAGTIGQDAATPSNPISNISGGALGVFNACRSYTLTVKASF